MNISKSLEYVITKARIGYINIRLYSLVDKLKRTSQYHYDHQSAREKAIRLVKKRDDLVGRVKSYNTLT